MSASDVQMFIPEGGGQPEGNPAKETLGDAWERMELRRTRVSKSRRKCGMRLTRRIPRVGQRCVLVAKCQRRAHSLRGAPTNPLADKFLVVANEQLDVLYAQGE